jgi:hypothetical protein
MNAALLKIASSEGANWLARVEAMKVLGRTGDLKNDLVVRSWRLAPPQYRCDLLEAVAPCASERWAAKFLEAAQEDPVEAVVVQRLMHQA